VAQPAETPSLGPIVVATVTVPDLDEATGWYTRWLGYDLWDEGVVDTTLAGAWEAAAAAGSRYRLLSPGRRRPGGVRLVERRRPLATSPLRAAGWRSLELAVSDPYAVHAQLRASPFRIVGEPKPLDTNPSIVALQAVGPGRELLYLTRTSDDTAFDLPRATRLVDSMFIAVLSARNIDRAQDFYVSRFGAVGHLSATPVPLEAVNRELGFPVERPHAISAFQLAGRALVEIDEHPQELLAEEAPLDDLSGGLAVVSFEHDDLGSLDSVLVGPPRIRAEPPYLGRRAGLVRGPDGERIEVVERSEAT
jgi:catechol 2,3-dioxygenase-like lactoylglutathione lyase family enzyme